MLAEHNLPMLLSDHASKLFPSMFPDSQITKSYKSAHTKTTALITNVISPELHEDAVHQMHASYFSLLVDESTDISVTQHLAVLLRIFDEDAGIVRTKFYKLLKPVLQCSHTHSPYCLILQPNLPQCLSCCLTCFGWS